MNRLRVARQSVSLCTPLTLCIGPMLEMAKIFLGLASMPRSDMKYLYSFPFGTSKTHFLGFNLTLNLRRFHECGGQVCGQVASLSRFHYYVIYIDDDCWFWPLDLVRSVERVDLVGEASLHAPLIGGASILQTKRHGYVTIQTIRGDE